MSRVTDLVAEVTADTRKFDRSITEAERTLDKIRRARHVAELGLDKSDVESGVTSSRRSLANITGTAELGLDASDVESGSTVAGSMLNDVTGTAELGLDSSDVEGGATVAGGMLNDVSGTAQLGLDASDVEGGATAAGSMLNDISGVATLTLDASDVESRLADLQGQMDGMRVPAGGGGGGGGVLGAGAAGGMAGRLGGMGGAALAGGAALLGGGAALKGWMEEGRDAIRTADQLRNTIETMGAGSWITAEAVEGMATRIQETTGASDEWTTAGANMLLTFANVRNEVGKGNDIFNQSTGLMADMATFMRTDTVSAATMMGKALNDPIKGMSAMSRVGVSFTEQQAEQIKKMTESGDLIGAQKVLLSALSSQFGGTAAAVATDSDRAKARIGDLTESIGVKLAGAADWAMPRVADFAEGASSAIGGLFDLVVKGDFTKAFADAFNVSEDSGIVDFILGMRETTGTVVAWLVANVPPAFEAVRSAIGTAFEWAKDNVVPVIAGIAAAVGTVLIPIMASLVGSFVAGGLAMMAAIAPVVAVGVAVAALVAGVIYAYKNFEGFRTAVDTVFAWLKANVPPIVEAVTSFIVEKFGEVVAWVRANWPAIQSTIAGGVEWVRTNVLPVVADIAAFVVEKFGQVVAWVKDIWPQVSEAIGHVMNVVQGIIRTVVDVISALWRAWGDDLMNVIRTTWDAIYGVVEGEIKAVKGIIETVVAIINGDWGRAWDGIKNILAGVWDAIFAIVRGAINLVGSIIGGVLSTIQEVWRGAWEAMKGVVRDALRFMADLFLGWAETIVGTASRAFSWVPGIGPKLEEARKAIAQFRDTTNAALGGIQDKTVNVTVIRKVKETFSPFGDGPGGPTAPMRGKAIDRVRAILPAYPGLRITSTYRTPAQNRRVGGSPTSYHMDKWNPAVDIGGPTFQLDRFHAALGGGWREKLWRTRGHYDHVHVAHEGGVVSSSWPTLPGLRSDERPAILQVGETVLPTGTPVSTANNGGVHINFYGPVYGGEAGIRELSDKLESSMAGRRYRAGV